MILVAVLAVALLLVEHSMAGSSQVMIQTKRDWLVLKFGIRRGARHRTITTFSFEMLQRRG